MATWHQQQAIKRGGTRYWHDTRWTVLHDPPNECTSLTRFISESDANQYADNLRKHGHTHVTVLRPAKN